MTVEDRAAALLDEVLGDAQTPATLLDAYAAPGGPLAAVPAILDSRRIVFAGRRGDAAGTRRRPRRGLGFRIYARNGRRRRAPSREESGHRGDEPRRIAARGCRRRDAPAARRHRDVRRVVTNVPGNDGGPGAARGRSVDALRPAIDGLERLLAERDEWLPPAADLLDGADSIGVLGRAGCQGVSEKAALLLRECPRLRATAHHDTDWLHTAVYTAFPGYRAVLLPGIEDADGLERVITDRGGAVIRTPPIEGPARLVVPAFSDLLGTALGARERRKQGALSPLRRRP